MLRLAAIFTLVYTMKPLAYGDPTLKVSDWTGLNQKRLEGYTVMSLFDTSLIQCIVSCAGTDGCKSINYLATMRKCEHSNSDARIRPNSIEVHDSSVYFHKEMTKPKGDQTVGDVPMCPPQTAVHANTCIEINDTPMRFGDARDTCREKYGDLVVILDQPTWNAVKAFVSGLTGAFKFYVGMIRDVSGTNQMMWVDDDNTPAGVQFFTPPNPDNFNNPDGPENCGGMELTNTWALNDVPCVLDWASICQYDAWVHTLW